MWRNPVEYIGSLFFGKCLTEANIEASYQLFKIEFSGRCISWRECYKMTLHFPSMSIRDNIVKTFRPPVEIFQAPLEISFKIAPQSAKQE